MSLVKKKSDWNWIYGLIRLHLKVTISPLHFLCIWWNSLITGQLSGYHFFFAQPYHQMQADTTLHSSELSLFYTVYSLQTKTTKSSIKNFCPCFQILLIFRSNSGKLIVSYTCILELKNYVNWWQIHPTWLPTWIQVFYCYSGNL